MHQPSGMSQVRRHTWRVGEVQAFPVSWADDHKRILEDSEDVQLGHEGRRGVFEADEVPEEGQDAEEEGRVLSCGSIACQLLWEPENDGQ